jgi:hypothetical protein
MDGWLTNGLVEGLGDKSLLDESPCGFKDDLQISRLILG